MRPGSGRSSDGRRRPLVPAGGGKFPHGCRDPGDACCFVEPHARERTTVEVPGSAAPRVAFNPYDRTETAGDDRSA